MAYSYVFNYIMAFCAVLAVTGVLVWVGAFEKAPSQITAFAPAETTAQQQVNNSNATIADSGAVLEHGVPKPARLPNT